MSEEATQPRVFVVQEPTRLSQGRHVRKYDLSPARQHGELVFIFPPGEPPLDERATVPLLRAVLATFRPQDRLLLLGHPVLMGWAAAIAARATQGQLTLLHWTNGHYEPVAANLFASA